MEPATTSQGVHACSDRMLQDMLQLDHLGDIGMSEMIFLMRHHVQEVTRFSTLIGYRLRLDRRQCEAFERDCAVYGVDPTPFLAPLDGQHESLSIAGIQLLKICAKVHDIGKPFFRQIYKLERRLSEEEFGRQKLHANLSRMIVKGWLNHPQLSFHHHNLVHMVADTAAQHQEKYDGSGYPDGIAGKEISLLGRLLAITDAISAIVNPRPYEGAIPLEECLQRLERDRGSHFDPELLDQSINILHQELAEAPRFSGEWEDLSQHSSDYIRFVSYIDFDAVAEQRGEVGRGDRAAIEPLRELVDRVLDDHQRQ